MPRTLHPSSTLSARRGLLAALAWLCMAAEPVHAAEPPPPVPLEEVPYVQTPQPVVDAILRLAELRPGDLLVDLGSGDGRIVIEAARRFGVRALGVEIDPALVQLSNTRAAQAGVADRVRFVTQDLFETDLTEASVITMYLLPDVNLALRPRLLALKPGTRLVSHDWDMGDWAPQRSLVVDAPDKPVGVARQSTVHRWTVPARIAGPWRGELEAAGAVQRFTLMIEQRFDQARVTGEAPGRVNGARVQISMRIAGEAVQLEGTVDGDRIAGTATRGAQTFAWRAQRAR
jgi:SAM-dependent methyltransferase